MKNLHTLCSLATLLALLALPLTAQPNKEPIAKADASGGGLSFVPNANFAEIVLTLSAPGGQVHTYRFEKGETPFLSGLSPRGEQLADGSYNYELVGMPAARERGTATASIERQVQSGAFAIIGGQIVAGNDDEAPLLKDQVILDDLIVDGSACIGFDCVNGEAFGFDTVRLKENNLRIKFEDTSNAPFPTNDWQITANDSANGGQNKFSIDDIDGGRTPFTIEARAPSHSLYVDDGGRLGLGTSIPVVDVHVKSGNSPTLRLEQDGSSGFAPQTWDVVGNETNFFVRDASNGSQLPLRIRPGAPTNALAISEEGDVGVGILTADGALHVRRNGGGSAEDLLLLENTNGAARFELRNAAGEQWTFNNAGNLRISDVDGVNNIEFELDGDGNLTTSGTVNGVSDRNRKKDFATVDAQSVLEAVTSLPITEWTYKADSKGLRHMGPVAQDFYAAFGLGVDERHIALTDMGGVALAAIQGLNQVVEEKDAELTRLRAEKDDLDQRVARLESLIEALAADR